MCLATMSRLSTAERVRVVSALVEGNSIRATVRMTGAAKNTVAKLLVELGAACDRYQDGALRSLPCKRIQCDEIWSFIYAKAKNVPKAKAAPQDAGDVWTWTAIDADITPAMAAGVADHVWDLEEIVGLLDRVHQLREVHVRPEGILHRVKACAVPAHEARPVLGAGHPRRRPAFRP